MIAYIKKKASLPIMWIRIFLGLMALMYLAFGLFSLFKPELMTFSLGVEVGGANGTFEIRGVFGGVSLGAAILCAAGAIKHEMIRPALWFLVTYMGGYCFARIASVGLGDFPTPGTWRFVAFEAFALIVAMVALKRHAE